MTAAAGTVFDEADKVTVWRESVLRSAGYDWADAHKLADRPDVDLHTAVYLAEAGCPAKTALRILL